MQATADVQTWTYVPAVHGPTGGRASGHRDVAGRPIRFRLLVTLAVAGAAPLLRAVALDRNPWAVVFLAAIGVLGLSMMTADSRRGDVALAVGVGLVGIVASGAVIGTWIAVLLPLAGWLALDRPPTRSLGPLNPAARFPAAVLLFVAALQGRHESRVLLAALATAGAWAIAVAATTRPDRLAAVSAGIGRAVGRVLTPLFFGALSLVAVVLPWLANRLVAVDPIDAPRLKGTTWIPLARNDIRDDRPWSRRGWAVKTPRWRRIRRPFGPLLLAVGIVAIVALVSRADAPPVPGFGPTPPAAFADTPWWDDYLEQEQFVLFDNYYPIRYPERPDTHTPYINIENGQRRTWQPPECACPTMEVWMYGGSTMFGMGQRDEHTIASALAKRAWRDGVRLEVHNRGVIGDLHWEGAQRFAWDVETQPDPDVVVFYDGYNDVMGAEFRDVEGLGHDGTPVDWTAETWVNGSMEARSTFNWLNELFEPDVPETEFTVADETTERLEPPELGRWVALQYERARQLAAHPAAAHGVAPYWFWQPSAYTTDPRPGEPADGLPVDAARIETFDSAADHLGPDVIDISDVFPADEKPILYDDVHTNELGAEIVADAIYRGIAPELLERAAATDT